MKRKKLSRNVIALSLVSLFNDCSSEITIRTLPLYLSNVLGAKTGIIGLIEGIADSTATILKIFSGWLSDKSGKRKNIVLAGYSLSSFSKPFLFFATSWVSVLLIRFADRVGKGVRTSPRDALIADSTEPELRGKAFGFNRMMDPIGGVLGLIVAGAIIFVSNASQTLVTQSIFRTLIIISIIPAFISVVLIIFFVRDIRSEKPAIAPNLSLKGFSPKFKKFLGILILFTLGNSSDAFLILRAQNLGMNLLQIFLMIALFNLISSLLSLPAGILSDKIGRQRVISFGWIVYGLIYLGFAFATSIMHVWILYVLYGMYYGFTEGVEKALVADIVAPYQRGTAFGIYNGAIGLAALPASVIAGLLWQTISPSAPFIFGAALSLVAVVFLNQLLKR